MSIDLSSLTREEKRYVLARSYPLFAAYYFDFKISPYQAKIVEHWQKNRFSLTLVPMQHGKSSSMKLDIIRNICLNPNVRIILTTATKDDADEYVRAIEAELTGNEKLIEDFGPFYNPARWTSSGFRVAGCQHTNPHDTLETFGSGTWNQKGHGCLTPETPVVTSQGCRPVSELKAGDFVLTHKGRYQRVKDVVWHDTSEDVYSFAVTSLPTASRLTGDHPLLVWSDEAITWKKASEIRVGDHMAIPTATFNGSHRVFSDDDDQREFQRFTKEPGFWRLYGYYVAEGNKAGTAKKPGYGVELHFRLGEDWVADACLLAKEVLGVDAKVYERKESNVATVVIRHRLFRKLAEMCGGYAHEKHVPYWVKRAAVEKQIQFVIGYHRGDGCGFTSRGSKSISMVSASFDLIHDLQEMFTAWGFHSRIQKTREAGTCTIRGRVVQQKDAWTITSVDAKLVSLISQEPIKVGDKHKVPIGFFVPGYRLVPVTAVYKEHYEGPVYDMEVREDHSFALVDCTAKNCEIVYVDDCVTEETCLTPEARAKQLRWFNMAVASGPRAMWTIDPRYGLEVPPGIEWPKDAPYNPTPGDPEGEYGQVIVMGTCFDPNDLYATLKKAPKYKLLYLDCFWDHENDCPDPTQTKALWPEVWPIGRLKAMRDEMGWSQEDFDKRMRNIARSPSEIVFRREWFYGEEGFPGCLDEERSYGEVPEDMDLYRALGFDPASGKHTVFAAYPTWMLLGMKRDGDPGKDVRYVIDAYRLKSGVEDLLDVLLDGNPSIPHPGFYAKYKYDVCIMEQNGFANLMTTHARMTQAKNRGIIFKPHETQRNKRDPYVGVQSMAESIKAGLWSFPYKTDEDKKLTDEIVTQFVDFSFTRSGRKRSLTDYVMAGWFAELELRSLKRERKSFKHRNSPRGWTVHNRRGRASA